MSYTISLLPLSADLHTAALQEVYEATPSYWAMYHLLVPPADQAERDLAEAAVTPGRTMMGIVKPVERGNAAAGAELIGLVDFRLHWPADQTASLGMIMVAEAYQRQGLGTKAWYTLRPWLTNQAGMNTVRLTVEQFNHGALAFFQRQGFTLTGEANRVKVGAKFVRLLAMEQTLGSS